MSTDPIHPLDPPYRRPTYFDGMLLEAEDFINEQEYHRKRLANALLRLYGFGTVAGLRVGWQQDTKELFVTPGVAVDPRGQVLELAKKHCLNAEKWCGFAVAGNPHIGTLGTPDRFVMADVYVRYCARQSGLRPAFPDAAADALDAVVPFRMTDDVKITLHAVPSPNNTSGPDFTSTGVVPTTRQELVEQVMASHIGEVWKDVRAKIGEGMNPDEFANAVFLARVRIPVTGSPLKFDATRDVTVTNDNRPLLPSAAFVFARSNLNPIQP
jgi:hypothetical protein